MFVRIFKLFQQTRCLHKFTAVSNVLEKDEFNTKISVKGWVKALRKMKENIFVDISDGSCPERLQIVVPKQAKPDQLSVGSSVAVEGILKKTPKGQLELVAEQVQVSNSCPLTEGYPFSPKHSYSPDYIRQHLHLRPRLDNFASLLRVRDSAMMAMHRFFHERNFINVTAPVLTSNDCEGAGEIFSVVPHNEKLLASMMSAPEKSAKEIYFDSETFLTVSAQLHLEAAALAMSKVYSFGPTFRAENSKSRLHLSEFHMVEAEEAFVDDLEQVMLLVEELVKFTTKELLDKCNSGDLKCHEPLDFQWVKEKFLVLTYEEALNKFPHESCSKKGLTKDQELMLVDHYGGVPIFIVDWPAEIKPFYMKRNSQDGSKVLAFDLLVPNVGELVGGSLREDDPDEIERRLGKQAKALSWYLDIRKYGGAPCGGFGLGFERYLQWTLNIPNIKDTIPFPRWPHNCSL